MCYCKAFMCSSEGVAINIVPPAGNVMLYIVLACSECVEHIHLNPGEEQVNKILMTLFCENYNRGCGHDAAVNINANMNGKDVLTCV